MSGMEPLAALGLASNVLQMISFSHETVRLYNTLKEKGTADPSLHDNTEKLVGMTNGLRNSINQSANQSMTPDQKALHEIASSVLDAGFALDNELKQLQVDPRNARKRERISKLVKSFTSRDKISRLEKDLKRYSKTLGMGLLVRICNDLNAVAAKEETSSAGLRKDIEAKSAEVLQKQKEISEALAIQTTIITSHSAEQHRATREAFIKHSEAQNLEKQLTDQQTRLLKSLKFDKMNEKVSGIRESHPKTFKWIFKPPRESFGTPGTPTNSSTASLEGPTGPIDESTEQTLLDVQRSVADWDDFSEWLTSDSKLYWISGKPGSGKSTMMKFLVEKLTDGDPIDISPAERPAILITHFFKLDGEPLQRDKRGLLSNLLHQVVSHQPMIVSKLVQKYPVIASKESPSDWSVSQLEKVFFYGLALLDKRVFVFIDGLDEICLTTGALTLLKFVKDLKSAEETKICVSSRPEPVFVRVLGSSPHLKLHQLTQRDIAKLAIDELQPFRHQIVPGEQHELYMPTDYKFFISEFVNKSEGVFLWAHLALQSLFRGFVNGDSWTTLRNRLDKLPSDLNKLYMNMWARLGDDAELYKAKAASFFKFVLAVEDLYVMARYKGTTKGKDRARDKRLGNLFDLKMAISGLKPDEIAMVRIGEGKYTCAALADECAKLHKDVNVYSAGLLEIIRDIPAPKDSDANKCGPSCQHLGSEPDSIIRFIHRTAREFLLNTTEGQRILACDNHEIAQYHFKVLAGTVSRCREFEKSPDNPHFPPAYVDTLSLTTALYSLDCEGFEMQQAELCSSIEHLYVEKQLRCGNESRLEHKPPVPATHHCTWLCELHQQYFPDFNGILFQTRNIQPAKERFAIIVDEKKDTPTYLSYLLQILTYTSSPSSIEPQELMASLLQKGVDLSIFSLTPVHPGYFGTYEAAAMDCRRAWGGYFFFLSPYSVEQDPNEQVISCKRRLVEMFLSRGADFSDRCRMTFNQEGTRLRFQGPSYFFFNSGPRLWFEVDYWWWLHLLIRFSRGTKLGDSLEEIAETHKFPSPQPLPEPSIIARGHTGEGRPGGVPARHVPAGLAAELRELAEELAALSLSGSEEKHDALTREINAKVEQAWDEGTDAGLEVEYFASRGIVPTLQEVKAMMEDYPPS